MLQFVLVASSVALSGVLRYGPSGTFVNLTSGNNLVAANYPPPNQPVTARSDFVALYDLSQVPSYAPATPYANLGNVECGALTTNTCHRQCTGCSNGEIISCPNKQHWAVTFDDVSMINIRVQLRLLASF